MCNLPVFVLVTGTMTWGSWSEERHCSGLNFPCATDGDLINEAQPRPFAPSYAHQAIIASSRFGFKYLICIWLTLTLLHGGGDEEVGG